MLIHITDFIFTIRMSIENMYEIAIFAILLTHPHLCLILPENSIKKPAFYHNADAGPGSQTNVDLYPGQWSYLVTLVEFVHEK